MEERTFANWINSMLVRVDVKITDLCKDLADGTVLIQLSQELTGKKVRLFFSARRNFDVNVCDTDFKME